MSTSDEDTLVDEHCADIEQNGLNLLSARVKRQRPELSPR